MKVFYVLLLFVNRTLQRAEIPIVDNSLCKSINEDISSVNQICAGGEKGNLDFFCFNAYECYSTVTVKRTSNKILCFVSLAIRQSTCTKGHFTCSELVRYFWF